MLFAVGFGLGCGPRVFGIAMGLVCGFGFTLELADNDVIALSVGVPLHGAEGARLKVVWRTKPAGVMVWQGQPRYPAVFGFEP